MRRALLLPLVLVACSQAQSSSSTSAPPPTAVLPAAAAAPPVAATSMSKSSEEDWGEAVPTQKFTDAQRSFEAAKKTLVEQYYDGSFTEDDLYRAAVAGMLERVDPRMRKWNKLLSPSEMAELKGDLQGEVVGVGIGVEMDPATGYIQVKRAFPGSPAERA
jgi:C-terminal processing protease CtpA/Prc